MGPSEKSTATASKVLFLRASKTIDNLSFVFFKSISSLFFMNSI